MNEPLNLGPHASEEELSAYYDAELPPAERRRVAAHLAACESCRATLAEFAALGQELREPLVPVPPPLRFKLEERLANRRPPSVWASQLRGLASVAALLVVATYAVLVWPATQPVALAVAYPARDATSVALDAVVEIAYAADTDRRAVEQNLHIEPGVAVQTNWRGDTLVIQPQHPLQPDTIYSVKAPGAAPGKQAPLPPMFSGNSGVPTPQIVTTFRTAPAAGAVAQQGAAPAATAQPHATGEASIAAATVVPTAVKPAAPTSPAATATQVAVVRPSGALAKEPGKGFGLIYRQPGVAAALGPLLGEERHVKVVEQRFERGRMLWCAGNSKDDEPTLYVLTDDGKWQSFPDAVAQTTATIKAEEPPKGLFAPQQSLGKLWRARQDVRSQLGWAVEPERQLNGGEYRFAKGVMLGHERKLVYVLNMDGSWQEYPDGWLEPSPTPVRTATASLPTASPTPSRGGTQGSTTPAS
ncbi:MAG: anti-sigma factor family protein [Chloroflexota bacterium]